MMATRVARYFFSGEVYWTKFEHSLSTPQLRKPAPPRFSFAQTELELEQADGFFGD